MCGTGPRVDYGCSGVTESAETNICLHLHIKSFGEQLSERKLICEVISLKASCFSMCICVCTFFYVCMCKSAYEGAGV